MHILRIIIVTFVCSFTISCKAQTTSVSLAFTGDIMMHYAVKTCALMNDPEKKDRYTVQGFKHLFEKTAPLLSNADFAIGNMEFPVSPPFIQKEFIFNCPQEVIPALKESGFDLVSQANNHIVDQGIKGALNTFAYLEKAGLQYFGAGRNEQGVRDGIVLEKNGIKVGILTYTGLLNYSFPKAGSAIYINNLNEREKLMQDISRMRARADFVIVQPHAGVEYTLAPTVEQKTLYRQILDSGADMIIGHHPHTLQYSEEYTTKDKRSAVIFYSLGNFICNQNYTYPIAGTKERLDIRSSAIVHLTLNKTGSAITQNIKVYPTHTIHEMTTARKKTYKEIQTVVVADEIRTLREKISQGKDKAASEKKLSYFRSHLSTIQKALFKNGMPKNVIFETGE